MINLEQIRLLETRITKAIEHVRKITDENKHLNNRLISYQERIDELEILIKQFRDDQGLIEDGILSALDRLNQFEDAVGNVLSTEKPHSEPQGQAKKESAKSTPATAPASATPTAKQTPTAAHGAKKAPQENHIKPENPGKSAGLQDSAEGLVSEEELEIF